MKPETKRTFRQLSPSEKLTDFVDSYWEHINHTNAPKIVSISPDSFFKVIIEVVDDKIVAYFLTGLWPTETEVIIPKHAIVYGIKFKILAPEYIFQREIASLLCSHIELDLDFWNMRTFKFDTFEKVVKQIESILISKLENSKRIEGKKLQLSQLLYQLEGNILAEEVSNQIAWSNRQINRYLNKYLGVSLKTYLNMQKVYFSYIQIREGRFFPDKGYFDQAHFIREVKKHTNKTPKELYKEQHDRFVQLKYIQKK